MRSLLLLLCLAGCAFGMASAGLPCFPSLIDVIANKFTLDQKTVFSILKPDGTPLQKLALCPGMTYTVRIEFPDPRTFWVSSTKGFFKGLLPSIACPNQLTNNQSSTVTSIDLPFTVSCNVKGVSTWGIASLPKADLFYKFLNISMPVLDLSACPASFCQNTTTNYTGSITGNSTIPAYGQCGGAGGECARYSYCDDRPFPGYSCTNGWSCQRQHRWYYQCLPGTPVPSATGCDFSAFGEPLATMMQGLGLICSLKSGLMSFAVNPLAVPKLIDPFAMLQVFSGLTALKTGAVAFDPLSLITSFKSLCDFVPNTNSTQAVMVAGMKQFLTVVTTKVVPASNNSTQLAQSVISVMTAMGGAAYTGSYMDLTKTMSLSSMLNVVNSFYTMLSTVKTLGLF